MQPGLMHLGVESIWYFYFKSTLISQAFYIVNFQDNIAFQVIP